MYTTKNYKTKKELKEAIKRHYKLGNIDIVEGRIPMHALSEFAQLSRDLTPYQPGLGNVPQNGTAIVEGPHYPKPHRWDAAVVIKDGIIVKAS